MLCFSNDIFCDSRRSKSRLVQAAGAESSGQMRDEKLNAIVARSTFASEKAEKISRADNFWDDGKVMPLHVQPKVYKTSILRPIWEVEI